LDITVLAGLMAGLLLVIAIAEPLASYIKLPFAVVLTLMGIAIGFGADALASGQLGIDVGWRVRRDLDFDIPSGLFLTIFLPILIFQVAISLEVKRMLEDWLPILVMAVLAVILATVSVGMVLSPLAGLSLFACLLIGSIVSTTDPSAVIDLFRSISAPPRLVRLIQGESLLNDATAIALFSFFLALVGPGEQPALSSVLVGVPASMLGGLAIGWVVVRLMVILLSKMSDWVTAQVTLTLLFPFAAFHIAEMAYCSGVTAVFAAGICLNLSGRGRLTPIAWSAIHDAWGVIAHLAGGLIFIMAALLIPELLEDATLADAGLVALIFAATLIARAAVLWIIFPVLSGVKVSPPISDRFKVAILWGGLRGAVTLALALSVIEAPFIDQEIKRFVGIMATGYVLMVFAVQGLTLKPLISLLGLDQLTVIDEALSRQVVALARQDVREAVSDEIRDRGIDHDIVRAEARKLGAETQDAVKEIEAAEKVLDSERVTLGLIALAEREKDIVIEAAREGRIGVELQSRLAVNAEKICEMTRSAGRAGYRSAAKSALGAGRRLDIAAWLHGHMKISWPLAALTAERIEVLIAQRAILEELHSFTDKRIRRIHGKRVTEILHEIISKREERVATLLDGLHIQFPDYAGQIESRWIRGMAWRLEEQQYEALLADNLIPAELYKSLVAKIAASRKAEKRRPRLDMGAQKDVLLRGLNILSDADPKSISKLARSLHVRHVEPDEILQRVEDGPGLIWLIGSGAVEVTRKGEPVRLGPGDFFGHITHLTKKKRPIEVKAITHGTIFGLSEERFRKLAQSNPPMMQHLISGAQRVGVHLDKDILSGKA
jgi:CPA1 family monovalent cation:H+ antiporter